MRIVFRVERQTYDRQEADGEQARARGEMNQAENSDMAVDGNGLSEGIVAGGLIRRY